MKKFKFILVIVAIMVSLVSLTACNEGDKTQNEPPHIHSYVEGKCECGEEDPNYVTPHVHSYESVVTAPTCTEAGYTTYTCQCGDNYKADEVAALGHTEVVDAAVDATCTEAGKTAGKHCSVCNDVLVAQEPVPALGHTEVDDAAVDATCTEDGKTAGKHCSVCNDVLVAQEPVPALGHSYSEGTCGVCGAEDPDYEAPAAGGSADFNTIVTTNPVGDSSYTKTFTTTNGWVINNSAIQSGGATDMNPQFTVIGPDATHRAICMNGKTSAPGKITSPTLNGGLSKLTINYTKMFTDTNLSVTVTITELSTGNVYTRVIETTLPKDEKYKVYTDEWVLDTPVTGEFTIVIVNNCPSNSTSNKDRMTILSIVWEGAANVHTHKYVEEVNTAPTCTAVGQATYTCSCGDNYTEELPVADHIDTNLDITCDFEGCTKRILPPADSKISLFTAKHMIIVSLSSNYYVEGVVTEVTDARNGVFVITDEAGDSIIIKMPINADGLSYSAWTSNKIVLGDIISVYGQPKRNTTQGATIDTLVQGGTLTVLKHEHNFAPADCVTPATCACLATDAPKLGHTDEDNSGFCDRCDWNVNHEIESIKTHHNDVKDTENFNATEGTAVWTGNDFKVQLAKGTGTYSTSATTHCRLQKNNELTISSLNGKKIVSIIFVVSSDSYIDEMEAVLQAAGYTYTIEGLEVTIAIDSLENVVILNSSTKTARITDVKIVFEKSAA